MTGVRPPDYCWGSAHRIGCPQRRENVRALDRRMHGPMRLEGSCRCGAISFSVDSHTPYPYQRCYCSICRKSAGGGGYAINIMGVVVVGPALVRRIDEGELPAMPAYAHDPAAHLWDQNQRQRAALDPDGVPSLEGRGADRRRRRETGRGRPSAGRGWWGWSVGSCILRSRYRRWRLEVSGLGSISADTMARR